MTDEPWDLTLPAEAALLTRLTERNRSLLDVAGGTIFQGPVPGADNDVYRLTNRGEDSEEPRRQLVSPRSASDGQPFPVETDLLRPVYKGRGDIVRFMARSSEEFVLFPYTLGDDGSYHLIAPARMQREFPAAWKWLRRNEERLRGRAGTWTDANWYGYSRRQNLERFERPKVLVPYMVKDLCAHWDTEGHFFVNVAAGGYGLLPQEQYKPEYVTALLNSRLLSWVLHRYSRAFRGDWFAARKGNLARLPIADTEPGTQANICDLFESCSAHRVEVEHARTDSAKELAERLYRAAVDAFDGAIEAAYGLSDEERELLSAESQPVVDSTSPVWL